MQADARPDLGGVYREVEKSPVVPSKLAHRLSLLREGNFGQPEIIEALNQTLEFFPFPRLGKIAACHEFIALYDIRFRLRCGQDNYWDRSKPGVPFT